MKEYILFGLGVGATALSACDSVPLPAKTAPVPPTATLRAPGPPIRYTPTPELARPLPSVTVICPDPTDSRNRRVIYATFIRRPDRNGNIIIDVNLLPTSGDDNTQRKEGEGLHIKDYLQTGADDSLLLPVAVVTDQATNKQTIHVVGLNTCVTKDLESFKAFFRDVQPKDIYPEQRALWNQADRRAVIGRRLNPQRGIIRGKSVPIFRG